MKINKNFTRKNDNMIKLNHSAPINFKERDFDDKLKEVSPQFAKVYNQALKAEEYSLDEIAGLGYRKALEFLIKDFAIYNNPEKSEEIKSTWMMKCLKDYIDNDKIKTLAEKSEWIGNDEAHDAETMKSKKENNKNE